MQPSLHTFQWAGKWGFTLVGPLGTLLHESDAKYANEKTAHEAGRKYRENRANGTNQPYAG